MDANKTKPNKFTFNNVEYDERPRFNEIDRLIINPLSLHNTLIEESIVFKSSVVLEKGYFESHYPDFKALDEGLKSDIFTFVLTYNDYLIAALTSAIRLESNIK